MQRVTAYLSIALALWLPQAAMGYTHTFANTFNKPVRVEINKSCVISSKYIIIQPGESGKLETKCRDQKIRLSYTHNGMDSNYTLTLQGRIAQTTKKKDSPAWNIRPSATRQLKAPIGGTKALLLDLEEAPNSGWKLQAPGVELIKYDEIRPFPVH